MTTWSTAHASEGPIDGVEAATYEIRDVDEESHPVLIRVSTAGGELTYREIDGRLHATVSDGSGIVDLDRMTGRTTGAVLNAISTVGIARVRVEAFVKHRALRLGVLTRAEAGLLARHCVMVAGRPH